MDQPQPPAEAAVRIPAQAHAIIIGALLLIALPGLIAFYPVLPKDWFVEAPPLALVIVAWVLVALGVLLVVTLPFTARSRWLMIGPQGLRYHDPKQPDYAWQIPWHALQALDVAVAEVARAPGAARLLPPPTRVRLRLFGAGGQPVPARGLAALPDGGQFFVLGSKASIVQPLDAALRQWAPGVYRGVLQEGRQIGRL